ncbi:monocarboxylate transporter 14-like [Acanthaster planci]|uniref:Monocarboxylate transporter 14-like n=1 Tax=Acanthaster planci TaxID=133434 RepID=A0A8B7XSA0_ACAPL|nr:monocarboxylate transporter 14-like [Acanthaster planci]
MPSSEIHNWPILLASFMVTSLTYGTASSVGVFYIEWFREFPESAAQVGGLSISVVVMLLCTSPLAGALAKCYGVRPVVAAGACLSSAGLLLASFARDISVLFITIPFMAGIGFGMSHMGVLFIISELFHKHYATANGIATTGTSVGTIVMPILNSFLIERYGWRGALVVLSAVEANLLVCAGLLRAPAGERAQAKSLSGEQCDRGNYGSVTHRETEGVFRYKQLLESADGSEDDAIGRTSKFSVGSSQDHSKQERSTTMANFSEKLTRFLVLSGLSLLWTNRVYVTFQLATVTNTPIMGVTLAYIAARAESVGVPTLQATSLISAIGIANIASRLTHGRLVDTGQVQPAYMYGAAIALSAVAGPIIASVESYPWFMVCAVLVGLSAGVFVPMQITITRQIVGQERFPGGSGVSLVFAGIGDFLSALMAGYLHDVTNSYSGGFLMMGIVSGMSTALTFFLHLTWTRLIPDDRWPRIPPAG